VGSRVYATQNIDPDIELELLIFWRETMYLTDFPHRVPLQDYTYAIEAMVEKLIHYPGVVSIYQIGSVSNPGISDIDIFAVFEDGAQVQADPLLGLDQWQRYLVIHGLFGACKSHFFEAQRYTFFHNYRLLWGEQLESASDEVNVENREALQFQIALEYLLKMFVDTVVEHAYDIMQVRGLLLHVKGISYDLQFLNVTSGDLYQLVQTMVYWRDHWFEETPSREALLTWFEQFYAELHAFLMDMISARPFYLPAWANLRLANNMRLTVSSQLGFSHRGVVLPSCFGWLGKKYFNVQHRFNRFNFQVPAVMTDSPGIVQSRFDFLRRMKDYNARNLSNFTPLVSSLNVV
jgi:hypothetical protein